MCSAWYLLRPRLGRRRHRTRNKAAEAAFEPLSPNSEMFNCSATNLKKSSSMHRPRSRSSASTHKSFLAASLAAIMSLLLILSESLASPASGANANSSSQSSIQFTLPVYSVSIPENSVGRVFAVPSRHPSGAKMGVDLSALRDSPPDLRVRFRVRSGDPQGLFKAEAERVGDFVFLVLRTRTSAKEVLNRERRDSYKLDVRARVRSKGRRRPRSRSRRSHYHRRRWRRASSSMDARATVLVEVTDTNDLDPFFQPSRYSFTAAEDAPLHSSVGRVRATDADLGVNGEVYYSIVVPSSNGEEGEDGSDRFFSVDASSGIVRVARPLDFRERPRHSLTVAAADRGAKPAYAARQADTAHVTIQVKQVSRIHISPKKTLQDFEFI